MEKPKVTLFEHLKAVLQLPFMVLVIVPSIILFFSSPKHRLFTGVLSTQLSLVAALLVFIAGAFLFVKSIILFHKIGNGTLAPWNPTRKMIIEDLYRHVRNPMLIGVNIILLSEILFFNSPYLLAWMVFFILLNHVYFIKKEEPGLLERFGEEYEEYCKNVPRWIPRISPWNGKN